MRGTNVEEGTYISGQLAIVEIALEDDEFALLEILVQVRLALGKSPVAAACSPEVVWSHHQLAFCVETTPMLEEELQIRALCLRQRYGLLASVLLVFR